MDPSKRTRSCSTRHAVTLRSSSASSDASFLTSTFWSTSAMQGQRRLIHFTAMPRTSMIGSFNSSRIPERIKGYIVEEVDWCALGMMKMHSYHFFEDPVCEIRGRHIAEILVWLGPRAHLVVVRELLQ